MTIALLTGCSPTASEKGVERVYKVEKEGAAVELNRTNYEFDSTASFSRDQKYKITLEGNGGDDQHFLVAHVIMRIGKKVESDNKAILIPISDRSAIFDCTNFYISVKQSGIDSIDDPVCDIQPLGYVGLTGPARAATSTN